MKSDLRNNPSTSSNEALGQRRDSSVMFSLSSLVAKAGGAETTPKPAQPARSSDDSGLIDLKALQAAEHAAQNEKPLTPLHVPVFPFGAPEPALTAAPAAPPVEESAPQEKKSQKGRWIAGAIGAVLVSALAIGAASAGPKETPIYLGAKMTPVFAGAAKQASAVEASRPAEPTAQNASATPADAKNDRTPRGARTPVTNTNRAGDPKPADPGKSTSDKGKTPPPPPPTEACDLMCQMRRATGHK